MTWFGGKVVLLRAFIIVCAVLFSGPSAFAADEAGGSGGKLSPAERAKAAPKGSLKNPIAITPEIIEEGKALYQAKTCGACHGPTGGGVHCPPLSNDAWVYGGDDDTLFRLVALGSDELAKAGYVRGEKEMIAGPMPGFSDAIADEQDLWKIVAFIRSLDASAQK